MGASINIFNNLEVTESSNLFKYSVTTYADLSSLTGVELDDLAYVKTTTGTFNPFTSTRTKGLYYYDGATWVYANEDLQNQISSNIDDIESNDTDILNLQNSKLNSVQAGSNVTIDNTDPLNPIISSSGGGGSSNLGTIQFSDTQYTTTNRLSGVANNDLIITNNKGNIFNVSAPVDAVDWWQNDKIQPEDGNGDTYVARLDFNYRVTQQNRNATLSIDIGGSQGKIFNKKFTLGRVANQDSPMSILLNYYTAQTFFANGGEIKLNVDGNFDIWDMNIVITKIIDAGGGGVTPPTSFGNAQFNVTQEFIGGFNFDLIIENTSANAVSGWLVTLENTNIASITQTNTTVNQVGNNWELGNLGFNGTINAGQTLSIFGLQGNTGEPGVINSPIVQNVLLEEV